MNEPNNRHSAQIPVKKKSLIEILQIVVLTSVILYFGKSLFIPLSISVLISFVLYPLCVWMEKKGLGKNVSIAIAMLALTLLIAGIFLILFIQFSHFLAESEQLNTKIQETLGQVSLFLTDHLNMDLEQQKKWVSNLVDRSGSEVIPFFGATAYSISVSVVFLLLIPIMSILILYHRRLLMNSLYQLFPRFEKEMLRQILDETINTYHNFIKGMLFVYLAVGILNSIGLAIIGIPNPVLFGFIAAILTFIPYVGIIIGALLPIAVSWITFNSVWYPLGVILVFTIVQYLEANIIFPFAVSRRMNVNTLVTILAIILGGVLWGAAGMIIFIPFLGILKLISDKMESLKPLSTLLGKGD